MVASAEQQALYEDLLRRSGGDAALASAWLAEMGFNPADFAAWQQEQQPATIRAVGTREHAKLGTWASAAGGKARLTSTDDSELLDKDKEKDADLEAEALEAGAPRHFFCPISMHIMRDPVMLPTGQSYDRPAIERWLKQNSTCPATGQRLQPPVALTPNVSLRNAIEEWAEKYAPRLLDPGTHKLRPVPAKDSFAEAAPAAAADPDLALALRLQQEEMARISTARQRQASRQGSRQASRQRTRSGRAAAAAAMAAAGSGRPERQRWWTAGTALLLAITAGLVAVFVCALWQGGWTFESLTYNPLVGPPQAALMQLGALTSDSVTASHQWWRLVSTVFVDAGVIQLAGNLVSLWAFGKYLERALPAPFFSLAGLFMVSGVLGALASANLNVNYVACGGSAGVCGLLGGVWADHLLTFRKAAHWWLTLVVMALITAVFAALSLLPLVDPFFVAAGLLAGFCCAAILLLLPKVGRDHPGSGWRVCGQALCACLLIGGATAAIIGLALPADVGQQCGSFCSDASCLPVSWWECVGVGSSPNGCHLTVLANGTQAMECPSGDYRTLAQPPSPTADLAALCSQLCDSSAPASPVGESPSGASSPAPSSGGSSGILA